MKNKIIKQPISITQNKPKGSVHKLCRSEGDGLTMFVYSRLSFTKKLADEQPKVLNF